MPGGSTSGTGSTNSSSNDSNDSPPLPAQFEANGNWIVYSSRIDQYFVAYNITDDGRKRAILLTSLSEDVYSTLLDLCFPDLPETKSFKDIKGILKNQYERAVCVYAERRKFYDAQQKENESVADYAARLRGLSRYCKFANSFSDVLRDKFVCGLLKGPLFNKAMELEPTAKLETCIELLVRKEAALGQVSAETESSVCYMKSKVNPCYGCGDTNHKSQSCKFKSYVCRSGNVKGHLAKVCKNKLEKKAAGHHYVELDTLYQMEDRDSDNDNERIAGGLM